MSLQQVSSRYRRITPWAPLVAFIVLAIGILDVVSTNVGLMAGAVEINPLMACAQDLLGHWWAAPKIAMQLLVAAIVLYRPARLVLASVGTVALINGFVVFNNFALAGVL